MNASKVAAVADMPTAGQDARADAFLALADGHLHVSYRLAHAILRQRVEAEDATHDAFVTAWRKWDSLRDPALFERWFDRILVNTCRNRLRAMSRRRSDQLTDELPMATNDPYEQVHDRGALWPAIERLTPDQRVVLTLRFYRDFSIDEIAVRLGVRPGTVKSRLHRAMRDLRFTLREIEQTRIDR